MLFLSNNNLPVNYTGESEKSSPVAKSSAVPYAILSRAIMEACNTY